MFLSVMTTELSKALLLSEFIDYVVNSSEIYVETNLLIGNLFKQNFFCFFEKKETSFES